MRARNILLLAFTFFLPSVALSQVTHGQKPKLPVPFATNSAGNGPRSARPPAGFLPTVPAGFRLNVYAADFKRPRGVTVAPNGDIFLADNGQGESIVTRHPHHTCSAQHTEHFVIWMSQPVGLSCPDAYDY